MSGACALQCPSTTLQLWRHHNTRYFPIYIFSKPRRKSFYIHNKSTFLFNKQNHLTVKTATVANMSANHRNQNILQPNLRAFCATLSCVRLNPSLKKNVCVRREIQPGLALVSGCAFKDSSPGFLNWPLPFETTSSPSPNRPCLIWLIHEKLCKHNSKAMIVKAT